MQYYKPRDAGVRFPNVQTKDKCPNKHYLTQAGYPTSAFTWKIGDQWQNIDDQQCVEKDGASYIPRNLNHTNQIKNNKQRYADLQYVA